MKALVIFELKSKHAEYQQKAEKVRLRWRTMSHGPLSVRLGKQVATLDEIVASYARVIDLAEKEAAK